MIFELSILPAALDDLDEAMEWYSRQLPGLEDSLEQEFYDAISNILSNPSASQIRYMDFRIYWLDWFPYGVHYAMEDKFVVVAALIHVKRSPDLWQKTLNG